MANVIIEGQTHVIPDALAASGETVEEQDRNLRDVLRPNFDLAAGATFHRTTTNDVLTITVLKAPGRKGASLPLYSRLLRRLIDAPPELSMAVVVQAEVQQLRANGGLDLDALIRLRPKIAAALEQSERDIGRIETAMNILAQAPAVVASVIPSGV